MINGVLVERTVKDVVPALQTNAEGLKKVLDELVKNYKNKQDELEKWKVCRHLLVGGNAASRDRAGLTSHLSLTSWKFGTLKSCAVQKKNNVQVVQS
jgi:hypothetical protein